MDSSALSSEALRWKPRGSWRRRRRRSGEGSRKLRSLITVPASRRTAEQERRITACSLVISAASRRKRKRRKRRLPRTASFARAARTQKIWTLFYEALVPGCPSSCVCMFAWAAGFHSGYMLIRQSVGFWKIPGISPQWWASDLRSILSCLRIGGIGTLWEVISGTR